MAYNFVRGGDGILDSNVHYMDASNVACFDGCKAVVDVQFSTPSPSRDHVSLVLSVTSGGETVSPTFLQACGPGAGPCQGAVHPDRDCSQAANAR